MSDDNIKTHYQTKMAAVIIGRFNPPTIGHYAVIDMVKKFIKNNPSLKLQIIPLVVVIEGKETSKDKNRNPLTGNERIAFMSASGRADGVKFLIAHSAIDAFYEVRRAGYEPLAIAAGSDRAETYLQMLNKYFKTDSGDSIEHKLIELPRGGATLSNSDTSADSSLTNVLKHTDNSIPISMVSASLARLAAQQNEYDKFAIITGLSEKPQIAKKLFAKVKARMGENNA